MVYTWAAIPSNGGSRAAWGAGWNRPYSDWRGVPRRHGHLSHSRTLRHCPSRPASLSGSGVGEGISLLILSVYELVPSTTLQLEGEHGQRQENLAAFAYLDSHSRRRCSRHRHCQCRRHPRSGLICPIPVLPLSAGLLSVLSAAGASLLASPQLSTSTELSASGGPVRRQHRQTIEPTGAEQLAGSALQSATASILSTAAALLKDVRAPAA